jgi:hypothetical protein
MRIGMTCDSLRIDAETRSHSRYYALPFLPSEGRPIKDWEDTGTLELKPRVSGHPELQPAIVKSWTMGIITINRARRHRR